MSFLIGSIVALWVAVIALSLVVVALARQIGVLHERIAPAGALMLARAPLKVGDAAPTFDLTTLAGRPAPIGGARTGRSQLLFFLAPDCPVCKSLIPVVKGAAAAERGWLNVVVASDGEAEEHRAFARKSGLADLDYVLSEPLGRAFGVSKLPHAVLIDASGRVSAMGLVNSREHLESLFEAKERGVASIQDYLARRAPKTGVEAQGA